MGLDSGEPVSGCEATGWSMVGGSTEERSGDSVERRGRESLRSLDIGQESYDRLGEGQKNRAYKPVWQFYESGSKFTEGLRRVNPNRNTSENVYTDRFELNEW